MESSGSEKALEMFTLALRAEEAVRDLYLACARRWPEERAFWERLAGQEVAHVFDIEKILALIRDNPSRFRVLRTLDPALFRGFVAYAERERRDLEAGETDLNAILEAARDIEQSIVEFDYPGFVASDLPEYSELSGRIANDTVAHRHWIMRKVVEYRKG